MEQDLRPEPVIETARGRFGGQWMAVSYHCIMYDGKTVATYGYGVTEEIARSEVLRQLEKTDAS